MTGLGVLYQLKISMLLPFMLAVVVYVLSLGNEAFKGHVDNLARQLFKDGGIARKLDKPGEKEQEQSVSATLLQLFVAPLTLLQLLKEPPVSFSGMEVVSRFVSAHFAALYAGFVLALVLAKLSRALYRYIFWAVAILIIIGLSGYLYTYLGSIVADYLYVAAMVVFAVAAWGTKHKVSSLLLMCVALFLFFGPVAGEQARYRAVEGMYHEAIDGNTAKAKEDYIAAAGVGNPFAKALLGLQYEAESGASDSELSKISELFSEASAAGNAIGSAQLGKLIEDGQLVKNQGDGPEKRIPDAVEYYRLAIQQGQAQKLEPVWIFGIGKVPADDSQEATIHDFIEQRGVGLASQRLNILVSHTAPEPPIPAEKDHNPTATSANQGPARESSSDDRQTGSDFFDARVEWPSVQHESGPGLLAREVSIVADAKRTIFSMKFDGKPTCRFGRSMPNTAFFECDRADFHLLGGGAGKGLIKSFEFGPHLDGSRITINLQKFTKVSSQYLRASDKGRYDLVLELLAENKSLVSKPN